ncbi:phosphatidate cytidylyltransferase [Desulfotalea psychrophila]|uniref:Phosphatidate cytidylyltransferase n=1 Tax=Desulfotalea psychrophila (strain LSv54 / DSM 12343) TaxID=177439 RepID=Q6AP36_DESPS|nr:phosphatidate cytidylyltransferase [Desulfotalea psychrophila]CAG35888.1 probable phosphatidate cytidylyltransferase [Desulfotalea psychrophila LSv54]
MDRVVPGLLLAGFWLLLLFKGSALLFSVVILAVIFMAANEYLRMAAAGLIGKKERYFLNLVLMFPALAVTINSTQQYLAPALLASFFVLTGYFLYRYAKFEQPYAFFARLLFGVFYIGFLSSYLLLVRALPDGNYWLIVASAITAGADSGGYFVGCSIGKHKLCPNVSPKKTIEGALGGLVFALIAAFVGAHFLLPEVSPWFLALGTVVLTAAGVAGDLTESIIKRGTGTKDSGTCLGGHGGILDRIDSLLFALPVLYTVLTF